MTISPHAITTSDLVWSAITAGLGLTVGVVIGIIIGVHLSRVGMTRATNPAPVPTGPLPFPQLPPARVVREVIRETREVIREVPAAAPAPAAVVRFDRPEVTR